MRLGIAAFMLVAASLATIPVVAAEPIAPICPPWEVLFGGYPVSECVPDPGNIVDEILEIVDDSRP